MEGVYIILCVVVVLLILGVLMLMYLNGHFTYKDEVVREEDVMGHSGGRYQRVGSIMIIKRTYQSGKITFKKKKV